VKETPHWVGAEHAIDAEVRMRDKPAGCACQLEWFGYFCVDPDARPQRPVYSPTIRLRDIWSKLEARSGSASRAIVRVEF
jgi:hypothetical protein